MEYRHLELASHLFDSCIFDEALSVLETGLLRTPVELPTSKETAILMTLAAYPLSHLGGETVKTMTYNSVHRGTRDCQKTPGARATALLRRLLEFSKGSGPAQERMKLVLRSSLIDHIEEEGEQSNTTSTQAKETRTSTLEHKGWDDVAQVPVDRSKHEGMDSNLLRDMVPHNENLKKLSDHLRPLLSYTRTSLWLSLWTVYGYYLACSGSPSAPHLSAWATVRPLLHVIQDIVEADPFILLSFYDSHGSMSEICNRILPGKGRPITPLFIGDVDFGPNFDPETIDHLREVAFVESMVIREKWVEILRSNVEFFGAEPKAEWYLLDRFTTFTATHHQVIPQVYPCVYLPDYYTVFIFHKYIKRCTQRAGHVVNAGQFLERVSKGEEKELYDDAMDLLEVALSDSPDRGLLEGGASKIYSPVLYAFYGHAQLWVKLALQIGSDTFSPKDVLEYLRKGRTTRFQVLSSYNEKNEKAPVLCKQEEDVLTAIVKAKLILNKYL
ncbi:hypothetical protein B0I72DRAFT_141741 [Yarrowia lipolytica]|jgi:hypothetical protein|uniref:YALI0E22330p n=2 Tax=Yarrowia lipolytica TaxID=4952 RepID=Q6C4Z9_YARLI|nr:YALI0E22330p [Yarrowia lipolytica CLIB122]AOW05787.1 hypothetical protein YALI1_E26320g [Yarrowia lipolytica]KAB8285993.1 hypothetical protein BKA91DRAFT_132510 [Yarrowia lipolytica]KAE8172456.1 hypothetical protein BKA90DRAFT_137251 [Yarrowia lipolytica]KAJ8057237.1 hypothetical protein LXG23DRAFT_53938 [Yarrowia lipolytica]RDW25508.1 hypothetical protein B0I71DRAFT_132393 [Yarrowia lipolytica]|eukprot:XP_504263.1 YALI0E22330p [Yarrowia lipolytica CLIB122]